MLVLFSLIDPSKGSSVTIGNLNPEPTACESRDTTFPAETRSEAALVVHVPEFRVQPGAIVQKAVKVSRFFRWKKPVHIISNR